MPKPKWRTRSRLRRKTLIFSLYLMISRKIVNLMDRIKWALRKFPSHKRTCYRVLTNSKFGLFYSNFLILTPTFSKVPMEKYGKNPNFSGKQHFYSYFQNPNEKSVLFRFVVYRDSYLNTTQKLRYITIRFSEAIPTPSKQKFTLFLSFHFLML